MIIAIRLSSFNRTGLLFCILDTYKNNLKNDRWKIVYHEMQKYLYKVGPVELNDGIGLFSEIVDFFEEGVALGKDVLEVTGHDVATFCDDLIKDSETYVDRYQESVDDEVNKAMKKVMKK